MNVIAVGAQLVDLSPWPLRQPYLAPDCETPARAIKTQFA
jgi:hypothetical protein